MKKSTFVFLFSLSILSISAQSKLEKIIDKTIATQGGREKLGSIRTIKMTGFGEQGGVKYPINYYGVHKKASRVEFSFNGLTGFNVVTNDSGFNFSPFSGMAEAEKMTAEDVKLSQNDLDLEGSLVNYEKKGFTAELLDNEDIDGVDAFQIKLTISDYKTVFYFIDPDTYYIIRVMVKGISNGQDFKSISNSYNFKKTADGLLMAHTIDNITYDKIEINMPLDEKLFTSKKN
jgi:hypothetical protein